MAKQGRGFKSTLLLAIESAAAYGTLPASPTVYKLPINSNNVGGSQGNIDPGTFTGRRDSVEPGRGTVEAGGAIAVPLCVRNIGVWFTMLFGEPVTTNVSTAGTLAGATGVTTTIGTWNAVTDGKLKVAIDSSAATEVGPIDFSSGAGTMALVAGKIQAAIRAIATGGFTLATVTFDAVNTKFVITSGTTGALSSVSQLTAPAAGTNITGTGFMKCTAGTLTAGVRLYQHIFKVKDDMPSATIEKGIKDVTGALGLVPGCKISKFSFDATMGNNELTASLDVMASNETYSDTTLEAVPEELELHRLNVFQGVIYENGVECSICRKYSIEIDLGLDGDTYCFNSSGNPTRQDINEGMVKVTGTIETLFKSMDLLNKAINGTKTALKAVFTSGAFSLSIETPEVKLDRTSIAVEKPTGLLFSPKYTAFYGNGVGDSIVIATLINDVATYDVPA